MNFQKYQWKKEYALVLVANVIYIALFYIIMNKFSI